MGYYEILCQLCAVSFAIARHRTATEPPEAGWDYYGADFLPVDEYSENYCPPDPETGCSNAPRGDTLEHLAGPGCRGGRAYSGANLSLAEMKGCRDVRAIIKKRVDQAHDFPAEPDDEPWERDTRYFLTGTGNGSPDTAPLENLDRARHGVTEAFIDNTIFEYEDDCAMPVHPTCWEIFTRVSVRALGSVDVHGLWKFRTVEGGYDDFFRRFPRHPAVRRGHDQWWNHARGDEWLVANPVEIPGFAGRLEGCGADAGPLNVNADVFGESGAHGGTGERGRGGSADGRDDPFATLPVELRLMVLELLPSRSIAALRLASRPMRPVPNIAFRRLLFEDLPWLWEARDLVPATTDWFALYRKAKFEWTELKGLRNRARIWGEVAEICERVRRHRETRRIQGVTGWEDNAEDQF